MEADLDKRDTNEILEGNFKLEHQPSSREIRLYISSEFADTIREKSCITEDILPSLRSHCKSLGLQFYAVDLCSAISVSLRPSSPPQDQEDSTPTAAAHREPTSHDESESNDHKPTQEDGVIHHLEKSGIFKLAAEEIRRCQSLSAGPNFITLLAQRYGYKPLHTSIQEEDFNLLQAVIEESSARNLLLQWYQLDTNAKPPEYVLRPWNPQQMKLNQWVDISDRLSKTVRKAARVALGKDVAKVQQYVMSAIEEEITLGIFTLKRNPNQCCFWFKRVFTDLLDQKTSDPSLCTYTDMAPGRRGPEFDQDSLKALNHLKEARLPAKYIGLDSTNIFEYPIKWHKGRGLDPDESPAHSEYLGELAEEMTTTLKDRISLAAESLDSKSQDRLCQEVMLHAASCREKAKTFMERPSITEKLFEYVGSSSAIPMVLYGEKGCGKSHIMAAAAYRMREKFPMQKMILAMRFIGISPQSYSIRNTLKSICQQISVVLEDDTSLIPGDFPSITAHFKTLLSRATAERTICILLDGVDQLAPEDGASGMSWLPLRLPPHVKIILSTASDIEYRCYPILQSLLGQHPENLVEVPLLTRSECRALLKHQLLLKGRTLTSDQETAVVMALIRCPLPLYADLLLMEVQEWKSYLGSKPWESAAPPSSIKDMTEKLFLDMEDKFGKLFFSFLAGCLTASKHGLTEMELLDVMSCNQQVMEAINLTWVSRTLRRKEKEEESSPLSPGLSSVPPMLWAQVQHELQPLVERTMGAGGCRVLRWAHKCFTEFAEARYLSSQAQQSMIYESLANYFSSHSQGFQGREAEEISSPAFSQPLFLDEEKQLYNARKLSELPSCLARSGRLRELQELLTDYHWLKGEIAISSCAEVVEEFSPVLPVVPLNRSQEDNSSLYELRLLRDALSLSINALNTDSSQLPSQLYGRLMPFIVEKGTRRPVLQRLVTAALQDSQLLLTPLQPLQLLPGGPLLVSMKGHRDAISSVAVTSPPQLAEGTAADLCIVSSSWDKTLKSWDLTTTGVLKTFDGHTDRVLAVALTQDGVHALSGSADTTVRMWHVPSAKCLHVMRGHTAAVNAVVTTTDGSKTMSGSSDGTIKVWNTDLTSSCCAEIIFTMKNHRSPILCMTLHDNQFLASGAKSSSTLFTDIISGKVLHANKGQQGAITAISSAKMVDSECYLLTGSERGGLTVRRMKSGEMTCSLLLRSGRSDCRVNSIAVSAAGTVYTSYDDRVLSVLSLKNGRLSHLHNLSDQDCVLGAALGDAGSLLLTGCRDSSLRIWDLLSTPLQRPRQHEGTATSVSISPCGTYGVSGGNGNSKIVLYDLENASTVGEIETSSKDGGGVSQVLVLNDSQHILVAFCDGSLQLWQGVDRKLKTTFSGSSMGRINSAAVSADGELLMTGNENAEVAFWNVKTGIEMRVFRNHAQGVVGVALARDRMVSASRDGLVCLRDYHTSKITMSLRTHAVGSLLCLAVSADSAFLVTGSEDSSCHVVGMESGNLEHVLVGHKGAVTCIKILPNCIHCLTSSKDGQLRIWDTEKGDMVAAMCVDAPLTSCDVSWRSDCVLYGTEGGWVSTALLATNQRALQLITKESTTTPTSGTQLSNSKTFKETKKEGDEMIKVKSGNLLLA